LNSSSKDEKFHLKPLKVSESELSDVSKLTTSFESIEESQKRIKRVIFWNKSPKGS